MDEERSKRLVSVVRALALLDEFSSAEAKQHCKEATAWFVTRTIGQLRSDGLLSELSVGNRVRYRWHDGDNIANQVDDWIKRRTRDRPVLERVLERRVASRPRERLLQDGARELSDADLLAILIRVGVPSESAIEGGQRIATRFASQLDRLVNCSAVELKRVSPAATDASYAQIMAGIELGRRIAIVESTRPRVSARITSTQQAIDYCQYHFARLAHDGLQEQFHIVTLDTKHKPIQSHCVTVGTLDASLVHPREVFRPAIRDAAAAVLLVHNHPSGDPTPSREDHRVTEQLMEAGRLLGIDVLDHIVVAREDCLSIRECES